LGGVSLYFKVFFGHKKKPNFSTELETIFNIIAIIIPAGRKVGVNQMGNKNGRFLLTLSRFWGTKKGC